jgi:hypothetical protein
MTMGKRVDPGQRAARFAPKMVTAKALAIVMGAADQGLQLIHRNVPAAAF